MPSCYSIACPAKRHGSGSSSDITKHELHESDMWQILRVRNSGKEKDRLVFCFVLFSQETFFIMHITMILISVQSQYLDVQKCRTDKLSTSDKNLQRSWKPSLLTSPHHAGLLGLSHCHHMQDPQGHWRKQDFLNCWDDLPDASCASIIKKRLDCTPTADSPHTNTSTQGKIVKDNLPLRVKPQCTSVYTSPHTWELI